LRIYPFVVNVANQLMAAQELQNWWDGEWT
jgi:hypothetical protein